MIAISMGDANGIGPELALGAWRNGELPVDSVVVGDMVALERCNRDLGFGVNLHAIVHPRDRRDGVLNVVDAAALKPSDVTPGTVSQATGAAAARYVEIATRLALDGAVAAIVTLPINKEATQLSIAGFSGHTEFIAEMCGITNYTMMLASPQLIVTHVSTHVALSEAIRLVTPDRVHAVIKLTHDALRGWIDTPRIAVAGLNPHAGEHGLFGREDQDQILPAIERARADGYTVFGPEAADTVFLRGVKGAWDAVVCMYHDQGHIPMKLLDFDRGVNVTLGLPIIRTSVDHGTAFDIAWQGKARTQSLNAAVEFALRMAGRSR